MTDSRTDTASVVERTRSIELGAAVVAAYFLDRTAFLVLSEETLVVVPPKDEPRRVTAHSGAILATAADDARVLTAGDDGKVACCDGKGEIRVLFADQKHRWIDRLAAGPERAAAWSIAK